MADANHCDRTDKNAPSLTNSNHHRAHKRANENTSVQTAVVRVSPTTPYSDYLFTIELLQDGDVREVCCDRLTLKEQEPCCITLFNIGRLWTVQPDWISRYDAAQLAGKDHPKPTIRIFISLGGHTLNFYEYGLLDAEDDRFQFDEKEVTPFTDTGNEGWGRCIFNVQVQHNRTEPQVDASGVVRYDPEDTNPDSGVVQLMFTTGHPWYSRESGGPPVSPTTLQNYLASLPWPRMR